MKTYEIREFVGEFLKSSRNLHANFWNTLPKSFTLHCTQESERLKIHKNEVLYRTLYGKPKCMTCGSNSLEFKSVREGYMEHCSRKCTQQDNLVRGKFKRSMVKNHGVEYTAQSKKLRTKMSDTLEENYGVRQTFLSAEIKARSKATVLDRYGVEHQSQNREIFEKIQKSGWKAKIVQVDGKTFSLRGSAEPYVVRFLHESLRVPVNNIITKSSEGMKSIGYITKDGRNHVYHPDILVKVRNNWWLLEVKSVYTAGLYNNKTDFYRLRRKALAAVEAGYNFRVILVHYNSYDPIGKPCVIDDIQSKSRKVVRLEVESHRQSLGL